MGRTSGVGVCEEGKVIKCEKQRGVGVLMMGNRSTFRDFQRPILAR